MATIRWLLGLMPMVLIVSVLVAATAQVEPNPEVVKALRAAERYYKQREKRRKPSPRMERS